MLGLENTRVVVHIGTGKAGSTSIQKSTFAHREVLLDRGILIPELDGRELNPRVLAKLIGGTATPLQTQGILTAIDNAIDAHKPKALFLSSEFIHCNRGAVDGLGELFSGRGVELDIVLYLREPVSYYVSICQQRLKATDLIPDPTTWRAAYHEIVQPWRDRYGRRLHIIPFQKSAFQEGLVTSLFRKFFGNLGDLNLDDMRFNSSTPGEVSCLLQHYFRVCYPGEPREFRSDGNYIAKKMTQAASDSGLGAKTTVKRHVAEMILANHKCDLEWLEAEEGLEFEASAYSPTPSRRPPETHAKPVMFSDVIDVDPGDLQKLTALSIRSVSAANLEKDMRLKEKDARLRKQYQLVRCLSNKLENRNRQIRNMRRSWSWRLTRPFRVITGLWRQRKRRMSQKDVPSFS